jgi:hypothetical protein
MSLIAPPVPERLGSTRLSACLLPVFSVDSVSQSWGYSASRCTVPIEAPSPAPIMLNRTLPLLLALLRPLIAIVLIDP